MDKLLVKLIVICLLSSAHTQTFGPAGDEDYIVVFQPYVDRESIFRHKQQLAYRFNVSVLQEFNGVNTAYLARLSPGTSAFSFLENSAYVRLIEKNSVYQVLATEPEDTESLSNISCSKQLTAPWNLERLTKRRSIIEGQYVYEQYAGDGVDVYVLDTGIDITHPEFQGRATWGLNAIEGSANQDTNGHGTAIAGVISSQTFGVVKKANLISVKVTDDNGLGHTASLLAGINWVQKQHARKGTKRVAVLNISLGGPFSEVLNEALNRLLEYGIVVVAAAGNDSKDACEGSPSSARDVLTVGGTSRSDSFLFYSNYGSCVDLLAPAESIVTTWPNGRTMELEGTSLAAPHVSGMVAAYVTSYPDTTARQLHDMIMSTVTRNIVKNVLDETPNKLAFMSWCGSTERHWQPSSASSKHMVGSFITMAAVAMVLWAL
eukprot:Colp12_sorted_trinity150504_noHs@15098